MRTSFSIVPLAWLPTAALFIGALVPVAKASVGVSVGISPANITNDYSGKVTLTISGLTPGKTVLVEKFTDFNGNGVVDAGDTLIRSFKVTDGQLPVIGGVRNLNVPGDDDATTNSVITVQLDQPGLDTVIGTATGTFIFRVSDPASGFAPVTQIFTVAQKSYPEGVKGKITAVAGGAALTNAFVVLLDGFGNPLSSTLSDAGGNYTFKTLPGNYQIVPIVSNFVASVSIGAATVATNVFTTNNFALTNGTFTISGRLTDASSGAGLAGIFVNGETTNNLFSGSLTDANGNYSFSVLPSQWKVKMGEDQIAQAGYLRPQNDIVTNITSASAANINFALSKATALIYGTVKDNLNNPLPGVPIFAQDQANVFKVNGRTFSTNANYTVGVAAGTWSVNVSSDYLVATGYTGPGTNVTLTAGQAVQANLVIFGVTAHLRGQVKDDAGSPITNMVLVVQPFPLNPSGAGSTYPATDANGNFDAGVRGGTWNIALECVSAQNRGYVDIGNINFNVTDNVDQNGIVLTFPRSTATISGTVKDNLNNPIMGVTLDASATIGGTNYDPGCVMTDSGGNYQIKVLGGTWSVAVRNNELNARGFGGVASTNVTISGGVATASFVATPLPSLPQITTGAALPTATQGTAYTTQLQASGGAPPYTWSQVAAFLPSGLLLNPTNGVISGTPGENGGFNFTVQVAGTNNASTNKTFILTVNPGSFPAPGFTNVVLATNGAIKFQFVGVTNQTYTFESSTNLTNWFPVGSQTVTTNLSDLKDGNSLAKYPYRFFRARIGRVFFIDEFNFHHYANGGNFGAGFTPSTGFPVSLNSYTANLSVDNDPNFAPVTNVFFTGPGGSGLNNTPASANNSRVDVYSGNYQSLNVSSPATAPGGTWSVAYRGTNFTFVVPDPQAAARLVIPQPTVTVSGGTLQSVSWIYRNPGTGLAISPPSFMKDVQLQVDDMSLGRVYNSPNVPPSTTNDTLTATVNWNNVSTIFMVYNDTLGNHYVVSFSKP